MYAAPTYLKILSNIGNVVNKLPKPKQTNANCRPWPVGIPKILGTDRKNPNFIPEAVRMLLFGPGVTYITKLYALIAKINSQVIIKFSRESLQTV